MIERFLIKGKKKKYQRRSSFESSRAKSFSMTGTIESYGFFERLPTQTEKEYKPLLEDIGRSFSKRIEGEDLSKTYLIGVQHFLPSTKHLFEKLIKFGFLPENMMFSDKPYSRVDASFDSIKRLGIHVDDFSSTRGLEIGHYGEISRKKIDEMWRKCLQDLRGKDIRKIIILDEGGRCIEQIPNHLLNKYNIVGIEQTRGGLYRKELSYRPFPVIEVASSAVKKHYESPIIAKSILGNVLEKISSKSLTSDNLQYGIVGNGSLGTALANYFGEKGAVFCYDQNFEINKNKPPKNLKFLPSTESVLRNSDCIFFCTGQDSTKDIDIYSLVKDKIFISCSSEDREFRTILKELYRRQKEIQFDISSINSLNDLKFITNTNDKILLACGGFPINFDRTEKSDPEEILLTRGLLMGSVLQALFLSKEIELSKNNSVMLDPYIQNLVLNLYKQYFPQVMGEINEKKLDDIDWIKENSGGDFYGVENILNYSEKKLSF